MIDSLRLRLTLWHVAVLSMILIVFSVSVYFFVAHNLQEHLDESLRSTLEIVAAALARENSNDARTEAGANDRVPNEAAKALEKLQPIRHAIAIFDAQGRLVADKPSIDNLHVRIRVRSMLLSAIGKSAGLESCAQVFPSLA